MVVLRGLVRCAVAGLVLSCGGVTQKSYPSPPEYAGGRGGSSGMASGGETDGGTAIGGKATGGFPSSAGTASGGGAVTHVGTSPSSGCGSPVPAEQVPTIPGSRTGYTEFSVTLTGATLGADQPTAAGPRQFFVRVPADYDPFRPYHVVYIGQGCGAYRAGATSTYPLFNEASGGTEQAVYVALSVPENDANPGCYDNNNGPTSQEWEAFELIHTFVESHYCVDNDSIFVTGFSSGAWLANMWGCYFGGPAPERKFAPKWSIRGRALVAGSLPPNQPMPCNGPGAGLWLHDVNDKSSLIATNIAALNLALQTNGCTGSYEDGPKEPWAPAEAIDGLQGGVCQRYTGCSPEVLANYPLVFCTLDSFGRTSHEGQLIPAFTRFVSELLYPAP